MVLYDKVYRYHIGLMTGKNDPDLSAQERGEVAYLLGLAVGILGQSGAIPPQRLIRMCTDRQQYTARVNDRVEAIITRLAAG
jgi:hypothetical protein